MEAQVWANIAANSCQGPEWDFKEFDAPGPTKPHTAATEAELSQEGMATATHSAMTPAELF